MSWAHSTAVTTEVCCASLRAGPRNKMPSEDCLSGEFRIFLRKPLLHTLLTMHRRSGRVIPFSSFLGELLETVAVDFRRTCEPSANDCPMPSPGAIAPRQEAHRFQRGRNRKITRPETIEQIVSLRSEGYTVRALATRFQIGQSSITRILKECSNADETEA